MIKFLKQLFGLQREPVVEAVPVVDPLLELAIVLTKRQQANWPDRDGECKRAAVYAQMVNSYPHRSKREISRLIEEALQCGE